jgi:hypothetical protein
VKAIYMIREKRLNGTTQYLVQLPTEIAREWTKISKLVKYETDPNNKYVLKMRLVKAEEL